MSRMKNPFQQQCILEKDELEVVVRELVDHQSTFHCTYYKHLVSFFYQFVQLPGMPPISMPFRSLCFGGMHPYLLYTTLNKFINVAYWLEFHFYLTPKCHGSWCNPQQNICHGFPSGRWWCEQLLHSLSSCLGCSITWVIFACTCHQNLEVHALEDKSKCTITLDTLNNVTFQRL